MQPKLCRAFLKSYMMTFPVESTHDLLSESFSMDQVQNFLVLMFFVV